MVLEHARDDLFIEGKSPTYSKIKKPENKQLQLSGTVDIADDSDATNFNAGNLTVNGIPMFEHLHDTRIINTVGTHTLTNNDLNVIIDRPDQAGELWIILPLVSTLTADHIYHIEITGVIQSSWDRAVIIKAAEDDGFDNRIGAFNFELFDQVGTLKIQSESNIFPSVTTNGWSIKASHFQSNNFIKKPARVASTANVTIATALISGQTIDGVTLKEKDKVLLKDQSDASENGVYEAGPLAGAPSRDAHWKEDHHASDWKVHIREGTRNANQVFHVRNLVGSGKIGTDDLDIQLEGGNVGAVTQITSVSTGVELNSKRGIITTVSAVGSAFEFTVTCDKAFSDSLILVTSQDYTGTGDPSVRIKSRANGSFIIRVTNLAAPGSFNDILQIGYQII